MADRRYVLVGSGIASLSAAEAIRRIDVQADITLVSEEPHDFYSRPGLAYLLRGDVPERQLYIRTEADVRALRLRRVTARVEQLSPAAHELILSDGRRLTYDRLLLATGALAVPPTFPGADLPGIVKLDGLDDTRQILKSARRRRPAVVVGGGITAMELAEGLAARGMRVRYFLRGERYWSDVLDETESQIVMQRLAHDGIVLQTKTQIERAVGANGRLTAVETQGGATVPCELLAVAIGVRPRIDLAKSAGLAVNKGIIVDEFLQSSAADVFAAGDCAEVRDPRTGAAALDVLWPIALRQGLAAGANMAGARQAYLKETPFNVTMLAGLKTTIIGAVGGGKNEDLVAITRGESEAWRLLPKSWSCGTRNDVNRVRLVLDERTIIGALVMGDQQWSRPLQQIIVEHLDVTPVRASLLAGGPAALEHLAGFYEHWRRTSRRRAPTAAGGPA
jgi:NAD(P)H-nitrite reductase large subunit